MTNRMKVEQNKAKNVDVSLHQQLKRDLKNMQNEENLHWRQRAKVE